VFLLPLTLLAAPQVHGEWILRASALDAEERLDESGAELRRARLGWAHDLTEYSHLVFEVDLDRHSADGLGYGEVAVHIEGDQTWVLGHQKQAFSLAHLTSTYAQTFSDRADTLGPDRDLGLKVLDASEHFSWQLGAFLQTDAQLRAESDVWLSGRGVWRLWNDQAEGEFLHLAASAVRYDNPRFAVSHRNRGGLTRLEEPLLDSILLGEDLRLYGAELAWQHARVSLSAELVFADGEDDSWTGGYVELGHFITDDRRNYDARQAIWLPVQPNTNFNDGGGGAYELAVRFQRLDLAGGLGNAGQQGNEYLFGVHAHLTPRLRVNLDAILVEGGFADESIRALVLQLHGLF